MILKLGFLINTHSEKTLIRQLPCLEDVQKTLWNEKKKKIITDKFENKFDKFKLSLKWVCKCDVF